MGTGGTRKANSPRASETALIFFALPSASGVTSISAPGNAKPGGRKTVPAITDDTSEASPFFLGFFSAAAGPAKTRTATSTSRRPDRLLPVVVLVLVFLILVIVVCILVIVLILVFVFRFIGGWFDFDGIFTDNSQVGAAFLTRQLVAFIQLLFLRINHGITTWTIHHMRFSSIYFKNPKCFFEPRLTTLYS